MRKSMITGGRGAVNLELRNEYEETIVNIENGIFGQ